MIDLSVSIPSFMLSGGEQYNYCMIDCAQIQRKFVYNNDGKLPQNDAYVGSENPKSIL